MLPTILKPGNGVSHSLLVIGGGLYCNSAACAIPEAASKANATVRSNLAFIGVPPFLNADTHSLAEEPCRGKPAFDRTVSLTSNRRLQTAADWPDIHRHFRSESLDRPDDHLTIHGSS